MRSRTNFLLGAFWSSLLLMSVSVLIRSTINGSVGAIMLSTGFCILAAALTVRHVGEARKTDWLARRSRLFGWLVIFALAIVVAGIIGLATEPVA